MKEFLKKIRLSRITKYVITFILFAVWITFFDDYNLMDQQKNKKKLLHLQQQESFYREKIKSDQRKLWELQTNDATLEKFAREQFQMKRENEDVYIIVEESQE